MFCLENALFGLRPKKQIVRPKNAFVRQDDSVYGSKMRFSDEQYGFLCRKCIFKLQNAFSAKNCAFKQKIKFLKDKTTLFTIIEMLRYEICTKVYVV